MLTTTDPTTLNTINTLILIGFSLLSATLTGVLKQVHWPPYVNDLVVFLVAVLCMLLYVWVDSLLTGSASLIFGSVAGVAVVVMSRFDPLQKWTNFLQGRVLVVKEGGVQLLAPSPETSASAPTAPLPLILPSSGAPLPSTTLSDVPESATGQQYSSLRVLPTQTPPRANDGRTEPPTGA